MKLCYIDESGRPGDSEWLFLGAFILDAEDANILPDEIKRGLDLSWREELVIQEETLKALRKGEGIDVDRRHELSGQLYSHLSDSIEFDVCCVIFYQPELDLEPEFIFVEAFKYLIERFQWMLQWNNEYGVVYFDSHRLSDEIQASQAFLRSKGTDFVEFENIVEVGAPIRDELSQGIQMADLVTSGIRAHFLGITSKWYDDFILPHVRRHPSTGAIQGVGIKVFPDGVEDRLACDPNDV